MLAKLVIFNFFQHFFLLDISTESYLLAYDVAEPEGSLQLLLQDK